MTDTANEMTADAARALAAAQKRIYDLGITLVEAKHDIIAAKKLLSHPKKNELVLSIMDRAIVTIDATLQGDLALEVGMARMQELADIRELKARIEALEAAARDREGDGK